MIRGVSVKAIQDERYERERRHYQIHSSSESYDDALDTDAVVCDPDCPICWERARQEEKHER